MTLLGEVIEVPVSPQEALEEQRGAARRLTFRVWTVRITIMALVLVAWQLVSGSLVREFWMSRPSLIVAVLGQWVADGSIWHHLATTLQETVLGFLAGSLAGVVVGLVLGQSTLLARVFDPFIVGINSLPKMALAPLFILWFGIGIEMKVVLAAVIVFFLVFYNTYAGVRDVDRDLIDIVKTMGARPRHILLKVTLPSALVWVFTGLRVSIPYALIGAVVGEIFASNRGIGYLIQRSASQFDTAGTFAGLVVLMVISLVFNWVLGRTEQLCLRWKPVAPERE